MNLAEFVQKFFLLLLPGIVGMLLYHQLNSHTEQHYYLEFLKMICLSLSSYLIVDVLLFLLNFIPVFPWKPVNIIQEVSSPAIHLPTANVLLSVAAACVTAFCLTKANDDGWTTAIAERLSEKRRKRKWESEAVWPGVIEEGKVVVFRDFVTESSYYGKIVRYSEREGKREIYLENVRVFKEGQMIEDYSVQSMYLSREHNEFLLEFPDMKEQNNSVVYNQNDVTADSTDEQRERTDREVCDKNENCKETG